MEQFMALSPRGEAALAKHRVTSQPQFGNIKGVEGSLSMPNVASASKMNLKSGAFNIPVSDFQKQTHSDEHPGVLSHQTATMGTFLSQNEEPLKQGGGY
jgi:hypothetical protein